MDYKLLWLGACQAELPAHAQVRPLQDIPSLMYLCDLPEVPACAVVLNFLTECPYSVTHVLSVAKLLSSTPHGFFLFADKKLSKAFLGKKGIILLPETTRDALAVIAEAMRKKAQPPTYFGGRPCLLKYSPCSVRSASLLSASSIRCCNSFHE